MSGPTVNWDNLEEFIKELKETYINERYLETIHVRIKYYNQKKNQEIHNFITEMKQLFKK